ncbi:hypothetical protein B0H21DRAFT_706897 [Amylocystis lapponica]|nr:hypothetical protein B0H21DRAFT_706897 [Amylocystis lapponica]
MDSQSVEMKTLSIVPRSIPPHVLGLPQHTSPRHNVVHLLLSPYSPFIDTGFQFRQDIERIIAGPVFPAAMLELRLDEAPSGGTLPSYAALHRRDLFSRMAFGGKEARSSAVVEYNRNLALLSVNLGADLKVVFDLVRLDVLGVELTDILADETLIALGITSKINILPNDALRTIIQYLASEDVLHLTRVCSRFQSLGLAEYFRRITYALRGPGDCFFLDCDIISGIPALCQLLDRPLVMPDTFVITISPSIVEAECQLRILVHLFHDVLAKPICVIHLDVGSTQFTKTQGLCALKDFLHTAHDMGVEHLRIAGRHTIQSLDITKAADIPFLDPSHHATYPTLNCFDVRTTLLFSKDNVLLTLRTINHPTLSSPRLFTYRYTGSSPVWALILPRISAPHLELFGIDGDIPITALYKFLRRHLALVHLKIGKGSSAASYRSLSPAFSLPYLRTLEGPSRYIIPVLVGQLPNLLDLSVFPDKREIPSHHVDAYLDKIMILIENFSPILRSILLTLPAGYTAHSSTSFFAKDDLFGYRSERRMWSIQSITIKSDLASRSHQTFEDVLPRWICLFPQVSHLALEEGSGPERGDLVARLDAQYGNLSSVTITRGAARDACVLNVMLAECRHEVVAYPKPLGDEVCRISITITDKAVYTCFIDDKAVVDDDDEEEHDNDDDDDDVEEEETSITTSAMHKRQTDYAALLNQLSNRELAEQAEEIAAGFRHKYLNTANSRLDYNADVDVPPESLLPTANNPGMWAIPVKVGKENVVVDRLSRALLFSEDAISEMQTSLNVRSFAWFPWARGFIHIEATDPSDVRGVADHIGDLLSSRQTTLIPLEERTELLQQRSDIDMAWMFGSESVKQQDDCIVFHDQEFKGGLQKLVLDSSQVELDRVVPTREELMNFVCANFVRPADLTRLISRGPAFTLDVGARVRVISGPQQGLMGILGEMDGEAGGSGLVLVDRTVDGSEGGIQDLTVPLRFLRPVFGVGDSVLVKVGNFSGKEGQVVGLDDTTVTLVERYTHEHLTLLQIDIKLHEPVGRYTYGNNPAPQPTQSEESAQHFVHLDTISERVGEPVRIIEGAAEYFAHRDAISEYVGQPVRIIDGPRKGYLGILRNITSRGDYEVELEATRVSSRGLDSFLPAQVAFTFGTQGNRDELPATFKRGTRSRVSAPAVAGSSTPRRQEADSSDDAWQPTACTPPHEFDPLGNDLWWRCVPVLDYEEAWMLDTAHAVLEFFRQESIPVVINSKGACEHGLYDQQRHNTVKGSLPRDGTVPVKGRVNEQWSGREGLTLVFAVTSCRKNSMVPRRLVKPLRVDNPVDSTTSSAEFNIIAVRLIPSHERREVPTGLDIYAAASHVQNPIVFFTNGT